MTKDPWAGETETASEQTNFRHDMTSRDKSSLLTNAGVGYLLMQGRPGRRFAHRNFVRFRGVAPHGVNRKSFELKEFDWLSDVVVTHEFKHAGVWNRI